MTTENRYTPDWPRGARLSAASAGSKLPAFTIQTSGEKAALVESGPEELLHPAPCGILRPRQRPVEEACTACARGEVQVRARHQFAAVRQTRNQTHITRESPDCRPCGCGVLEAVIGRMTRVWTATAAWCPSSGTENATRPFDPD